LTSTPFNQERNTEPHGRARELAQVFGVERLTVGQHRKLQSLGEFDTMTFSPISTRLTSVPSVGP
jgi:hypothetical protein